LEQNAFDLVTKKVGEVLEAQGYSPLPGQKPEEGVQSVVFAGEDSAYSILYRAEQKRFELKKCDMTDDGPSGKWKSLSVWLFDPETDTPQQAQSIVEDFTETVAGPKKTAVARSAAKKKRRKDDDSNVDPIFFFNRFVGVFPELKDELSAERETYGDVRAVTFAREKLLPKLEALCSAGTDSNAISRSCTLLNEMYVSGDLDVRALITIVILNGLSDAALEVLKPLFTPEMAKGYKSGRKMKGKKVKPEKKKKRSKIMAETLNEMSKR
jgi:hypothetical protein